MYTLVGVEIFVAFFALGFSTLVRFFGAPMQTGPMVALAVGFPLMFFMRSLVHLPVEVQKRTNDPKWGLEPFGIKLASETVAWVSLLAFAVAITRGLWLPVLVFLGATVFVTANALEAARQLQLKPRWVLLSVGVNSVVVLTGLILHQNVGLALVATLLVAMMLVVALKEQAERRAKNGRTIASRGA